MNSDPNPKFRVLRGFPKEDPAASGGDRRNSGHSDAPTKLVQFCQGAFEAIWSRVTSGVDEPNSFADINVGVFERVKQFCREAHQELSEEIPVGALFTGSLIRCHEVEPFELLAEVLRVDACNVATVDALDAECMADIIQSCLNQLTHGEECDSGVNDFIQWFASNSEKPLVILIEMVEMMDAGLLTDLISVLAQNRTALPVTLLVGLSTNTCVGPLLPSDLESRVSSRPFALMSPRQCFERILEKTLLSPACPGIVAGRCVMEMLNNLYLYHHFTIKFFKNCLRQALWEHLSSSPFGVLLTYMNMDYMNKKSLKKALNEIPDYLWESVSPLPKDGLPECMHRALQTVSGWKTTLLWLNIVAEIVGSVTRGAGHSLRELYLNALHPGFAQSHVVPKVVMWASSGGELAEKIKKLEEALERMKTTGQEFGNYNAQLKDIINRLDGYQEELRQSRESLLQAAPSRPSEKKQHKSNRSKKKEERSKAFAEQSRSTFLRICQEVDGVVWSMVEMYCSTPPEQTPDHKFFCLSSSDLMKKRLFAAPRLEILNLLRDEEAQKQLKDDGNLLKDSGILYKFCVESPGRELNANDAFISFAERYGVIIPQGTPCDSHVSDVSAFNPDSQDREENHNPDIKDLLIRFEWAVRALEELGIITRVIGESYNSIRLEIFND